MLRDYLDRYYPVGKTNCAESALLAVNDCYDLKLSKECIRMMGGFGGGCGSGKICGALVGCISALGLMEVETCAHESETIRPKTVEMVRRFEERFGSIDCKEVRVPYLNDPRRCADVVLGALDILGELLDR